MKKIVIFIVLAASMSSMLSAQDTVWQKLAPRSYYYYNNWLDTTQRYACSYPSIGARVTAKRFIASDTLQIYGLAALMVNYESYEYHTFPSFYTPTYPTFESFLESRYTDDPTMEHCEEALKLFQYQGGASPVMQQVGDSLLIRYLYTPASYYIMSNTSPVSFIDTIAKPVYELYFSAPQSVFDTFYVGYTNNSFEYVERIVEEEDEEPDTVLVGRGLRPSLTTFGFVSVPSMDNGYLEYRAYLIKNAIDEPHTWRFERGYPDFTMYIFPILNPKPDPEPDTTFNPIDTTDNPIDTTVGPDSTLTGIGKVDMVGRYVSVSPNPAGDRATVVSSFGLTAIEAYDPQGRQLYTAPATGLKAELDVSAWPRGTVLLHIHTPAGTTVKKLLLR